MSRDPVRVDYDRIGPCYPRYRRTDPRIAARIAGALGACRSVVNVGAGAGSYEPVDRLVVAVDPSDGMLHQRARGAARAVRAMAERLPFADGAFEASLAVLTIHHWVDQRQGLLELRRVARRAVVVLTWDPVHDGFWLVQDYFPEILAMDRAIFPSLGAIEAVLGPLEIQPLPIPADCLDGFLGAYWRRPAAYLDAGVRCAISCFARMNETVPGLERLAGDLAAGTWEDRHRDLSALAELDIGYRLVVARTDRSSS